MNKFKLLASILVLASSYHASAAAITYNSEASYTSTTGAVNFESFEGLAGRARQVADVVTPSFTISSTGLVGIQTAANSPGFGNGSFASDGNQYLYVYTPNVTPADLVFTFSSAINSFGFYITDTDEDPGVISVTTNLGEASSGLTLATLTGTSGNGSLIFLAFSQDIGFTQVRLSNSTIDDAFGIDKVYSTALSTPLPAAAWLFGTGLIALGSNRRRKQ